MIGHVGLAVVMLAVGWLMHTVVKTWPAFPEDERPRVRLGLWCLAAFFALGGVLVLSLQQIAGGR